MAEQAEDIKHAKGTFSEVYGELFHAIYLFRSLSNKFGPGDEYCQGIDKVLDIFLYVLTEKYDLDHHQLSDAILTDGAIEAGSDYINDYIDDLSESFTTEIVDDIAPPELIKALIGAGAIDRDDLPEEILQHIEEDQQ